MNNISVNFPYTYISIINGDKINYGSMKIKHQKKLLELSENIDDNENSINNLSFLDLFKRICIDLIDYPENKLFYVDFEYLMFLIRGKSYGDKIEYSKKINDKTENFSFDIGKDFSIIGEKNLNKINVTLSNKNVVEISPIYLNEIENLSLIKNENLLNYSILTYSLRKAKNNDEVIVFNDYEEKTNYINELTIDDLKELKNAYNKFPRINGTQINIINNNEYKTDFLDLASNFFVFV